MFAINILILQAMVILRNSRRSETKMKVKHKMVLVLLLVSTYYITNAQSANPKNDIDTQLWTATEQSYKGSDKWNFTLTEQMRLHEQLSELNRWLIQLEATYSPWAQWDVIGGLRYFIRPIDNTTTEQDYKHYTRWQIDLVHTFELQQWKVKNRLRYQSQKQVNSHNLIIWSLSPITDWRWSSTLSYNLKESDFTPLVGGELFWHQEVGNLSGFTKYRWYVGTKYQFNKRNTLSLVFMQQRAKQALNLGINNVFRLTYAHELKRKDPTEE